MLARQLVGEVRVEGSDDGVGLENMELFVYGDDDDFDSFIRKFPSLIILRLRLRTTHPATSYSTLTILTLLKL